MSLETIFATNVVSQYNVKLLHWNVIGRDFYNTHALFDEISKEMSNHTDEIAEILISLNKRPLSLEESINYLKHNDEYEFLMIDPESKYDTDTALYALYRIGTINYEIYTKVNKDDSLPKDVLSVLDNHMMWYRKEILYKLHSTLTTNK